MKFDYVIVGGGTAGCVLAARLAAREGCSVALLEAGPEDNLPEIAMPAALGLLFKTHVDWDFDTDPEPQLEGRCSYLPRGRMLGGSSSLNGMVYIRGNRADFDEWESLGCAGWGYPDVLPYFRRSEDNERGEDEYHGVGGPLSVSDSRSGYAISDAWLEAAISAGHPHNPDFNGASQAGVGRFQLTQRDGERCSTSRAFLAPARGRANLTVMTDTYALRVQFDGQRASGVEIVRHGRVDVIEAECEIVVCAGAYQSAQLLMLSGIGPEAELRGLGLEVLQDLPVGGNLLDHPMVLMSYITRLPGMFSSFTPENVQLYQRERRGPLTRNGAEAGGFMATGSGLEGPDIQFHAGVAAFKDNGLSVALSDGHSFGPNLAKPSSRGKVMLRSAMPTAKPRIIHNFLATEDDRATMLEGVRLALEMADQPALRDIRVSVYNAPASRSDADIMEFVRRSAQTDFHAAGTCAMGRVLDPQLRVLGVEALRVADASVMPTIIRGNTAATTIMIAEKAADMIADGPPGGALLDREAAGSRQR
jgi:choline dehydrogenase